jgi:hypothetical protein
MKTETIELVQDCINDGIYWGEDEFKFNRMQDLVFNKLDKAMKSIDPELKGFVGEY